jgi:hypothetical protein
VRASVSISRYSADIRLSARAGSVAEFSFSNVAFWMNMAVAEARRPRVRDTPEKRARSTLEEETP